MACSSYEYPYDSPCPLGSFFGGDFIGASSSPSSYPAEMPATGGLPEPALLSQLMSAVHQLQFLVTSLADSILVDRQQRAVDRQVAAAERVAAINEASLLRAAERDARETELRCSLERIDALALVQQQLIQSVAVKPQSPWICPVCHEPLVAMRSFKGHIKRLYEYTKVDQHPDSRQRKCSLKAHLQHHQALVARSSGDSCVPGDKWVGCARAFAAELWRQVQNLTSSDEFPDLVGVTGVIDDDGDAPDAHDV
jgi:hypothetical protein